MKFFSIIGICFVSTSYIFALPIEKWLPEKAKVGDVVTYEIEISNANPKSIQYPQLGFYPQTELPSLEILSIDEEQTKFKFAVRFLEAGEFTFPIEWTNTTGEQEKAQLKIQIESNLTGSEFDVYDIVEPIEFSGPFLLRVLTWIFGTLFVLGIISYFILKIQKKPKPSLDAKYTTVVPERQKPKLKESLLLKLLEQEEILHKEFVYLLSLEVKNLLQAKYKIDPESFTNKELMEFIQSKTQITNLEKIRMENYLDMVKYMPNEEKISNELAKKIYKQWMDMLKK